MHITKKQCVSNPHPQLCTRHFSPLSYLLYCVSTLLCIISCTISCNIPVSFLFYSFPYYSCVSSHTPSQPPFLTQTQSFSLRPTLSHPILSRFIYTFHHPPSLLPISLLRSSTYIYLIHPSHTTQQISLSIPIIYYALPLVRFKTERTYRTYEVVYHLFQQNEV